MSETLERSKPVCRDPADIHRLFIISLLKRDVEAALSLYHPRARFIPGPGQEAVSGQLPIREQLEKFAVQAPDMKLVERTMTVVDNHAQVKMQWMLEATGEVFTALDVLQREADGRWLFLIDNPYGC